MQNGMADGMIEIRLPRWHDYCAFYEHVTGDSAHCNGDYWGTFQFLEDILMGHKEGHWTAYAVASMRGDMEELAKFAKTNIDVKTFQTSARNPARQIEALDWPLFYGKATPADNNRFDEPWCFTSLNIEPHFVALRADKNGNPLPDTPARERELFLRGRQLIEQFARTLDAHCTIEESHRLTGPQWEEWSDERSYTWYTDTDEEKRRRRLSDTGKATTPAGLLTATKKAEPALAAITDGDIEDVLHGPVKGRKVTPYTADEGFSSVLQAARMRRRSAASRGR
jgi:hypothetical protein